MAIVNLFSLKQAKLRGEFPEVYVYDNIPAELRSQIIYILDDVFRILINVLNKRGTAGRNDVHQPIVDVLRREYGVFVLATKEYQKLSYWEELQEFILNESNHERVLDAVEITFRYISVGHKLNIDEAITELNHRFQNHGVGYRYEAEAGEIIRVDSTLLHQEAVKPALVVLSAERFAGANEEFLKAHEHYRQGRYKEALNSALCSFESVMKVICTSKGWKYTGQDRATRLIDICFKNKLIPDFWQSHFSGLRSLLESGVPTGRNNMGAHGQGADPLEVPRHIAGFIMHMTASAILFLAESSDNQR